MLGGRRRLSVGFVTVYNKLEVVQYNYCWPQVVIEKGCIYFSENRIYINKLILINSEDLDEMPHHPIGFIFGTSLSAKVHI